MGFSLVPAGVWRVVAAALVALLAAPAQAGGFRCPEDGGPKWREVDTEHFAVFTDLSSGKAQDLAREVERIYLVVRQSVRPPQTPGRIRVIAFADVDQFRVFAPPDAVAYFLPSTDYGATIVMADIQRDVQRRIIAHELTHHLAAMVFARQPRWFAEGLATRMETIGGIGPDDTPTVGGMNRIRHSWVYPYHGGVAKVLGARGQLEGSVEYAIAWGLLHFLTNQRPKELAELANRLIRGQDPDAAWREVFPEWDPAKPGAMDALDDALGRYLAHGKFTYSPVRLPPEGPVTERPMGAAEVHGLRLTLPRLAGDAKVGREALRAEIDEALRHDPGSVAALQLRAGLDRAAPLPAAERAVAAHPEDARAWLFLARALPRDEAAAARREAALRKAVEVGPGNPELLDALARELLAAGRSGEALPIARQAAALAPWNPRALDGLSAVAEDLGQCLPALDLERRAMDILSEGVGPKVRSHYARRRARLEAACGSGAAAGPRSAEDDEDEEDEDEQGAP